MAVCSIKKNKKDYQVLANIFYWRRVCTRHIKSLILEEKLQAMKYLPLLIFLAACSQNQKSAMPFLILSNEKDDWVHYEGQWLTEEGVVQLELSLKEGVAGVESEYRLHERFSNPNIAGGTSTRATYSSFSNGNPGKGVRIILHDLSAYSLKSYFRYRKAEGFPEEMFFISYGQDVLIPCDDEFVPLTTDVRWALHRRSEPVTVEGYVTFEDDSVDFYERNTFKHYKLANLGEFQVVQAGYKEWAKEKHEGVYVKAVAYTVTDTTHYDLKAIVIKRIIQFGSETENGHDVAPEYGPGIAHDVVFKKGN